MEAPKQTQAPQDTGSGAWWSKFGTPQYGGTISVRTTYLRHEFGNNDWRGWGTRLQYEDLFVYDWTIDPAKWDFSMVFVPWEYRTGMLAEKWEQPDSQTFIIHLRQGVRFANVPPVSGRELTSTDVVKHYQRMLGTGGGYTAPLPMMTSQIGAMKGASVTAVDKYTVNIKLVNPAALGIQALIKETALNQIEAPETVSVDKPLPEWKQCIGTGAFVLTDFTSESSATFTKNPDYWRFDARYPKNKLPYVDSVKLLSIPDAATAMAALRTGKIDYLDGLFYDQAQTILKSNPELKDSRQWNAGPSIEPKQDVAPFKDIRVRKAMQMALNLPAIAKAFYPEVNPIPCGIINSSYTGFCYAYNDWPQSLKDEFAYNPTAAKKLLADAGYATGFDTSIQADATQGLDLLQAIVSYFKDVGIRAEIQTMDTGTLSDVINARKHVIRYDYGGRTGANTDPFGATGMRLGGAPNNENMNNDPEYTELYNKMNSTTNYNEAVKLAIQLDKFGIEQHYGIVTFPIFKHTIYQPYLMGYNGQYTGGASGRYPGPFYSQLWIDQAAKAALRK